MSLPPPSRAQDTTSSAFTPRAVCMQCRRPRVVCYCANLTQLPTQTRVVLLQHPRERDVAIGTARMASLCLPNSELHVGVNWENHHALQAALADPTRQAALLYPGEGARDIATDPPNAATTLVVVDGTWSQTKKLVRTNPVLAALPRYSFRPEQPSEYRIRKEPLENYVSTIEALVLVLGILEKDPERFKAMLLPFRAMIDTQIDCAQSRQNSRANLPRKVRAQKPKYPNFFRENAGNIVCVAGEANAWPFDAKARKVPGYVDELFQWTAYRLGDGATFDGVQKPKAELAPRTQALTEIDDDVFAAAIEPAALRARWNKYLQPTDILCFWGPFALNIFGHEGANLPENRQDLRELGRRITSAKVGTVDDYAAREQLTIGPALARGRAGRRLAKLVAIAQEFCARAQSGL